MIYKKDSKGKIRTWYAEVVGDQYRISTGILDGKVVTSKWTVAKPKNVARSNETTGEEQAKIQVAALREKKLSVNYHETLDTVDETKVFEPMLATKYLERRSLLDWSGSVLAQPKHDGIRMVATAQGLFSRYGKPITTMAHIADALSPIFAQHPELVLDGELYNHELHAEFQQIVKLVKRKKVTPEQQAKAESLIQYHIYDVAQGVPGTYTERHTFLTTLVEQFPAPGTLHIVGFKRVGEERSLMSLVDGKLVLGPVADRYLADGYEGTMVRIDDNEYQMAKRSPSLMKLKLFDDAEFEVLGFEEANGNWAGTAKIAIIRREDGSSGVATMRGTIAFLRGVWENPDPWIGKMATVRYFGHTDDGQLRHPTVKIIHQTPRI